MGEYPNETRAERLTRLLSSETFMNTIKRTLAAGGSVLDMCECLDVDVDAVMDWINVNAARKSIYKNAIEARDEWSKEMVLRELRRAGQSDIRDVFNEQGAMVPVHEWTDEAARAVASVKVKELTDNMGNVIGELKEIKFWDKTKSLELIGKNLKMFTDKTEHSLTKSLEDILAESNKG